MLQSEKSFHFMHEITSGLRETGGIPIAKADHTQRKFRKRKDHRCKGTAEKTGRQYNRRPSSAPLTGRGTAGHAEGEGWTAQRGHASVDGAVEIRARAQRNHHSGGHPVRRLVPAPV